MSLALQGALLVRLIMGAIFVAVQRPQFAPVCVASNMILPVGVIVLAADMGMFGVLATKALLARRDNSGPARSNTLIFFTAAFGIWTGLSIPLFLGLESTGYAFRTILPAVGLLILIGIVALSTTGLVSLPTTSILHFHKGGSFESANVEMETRNIPDPAPSQGVTSNAPPVLPLIRQPSSGRGIGGLPIEGELFPPMRPQEVTFKPHSKKQMTEKAFNGGKIVISKPVITATTDTNAFDHIQTIDLAAAAVKERERREKIYPLVSFDAMLNEPLFPKTRDLTANWQTSNGKSWYVDQSNSPPAQERSFATTSAVQLSPGMDETRRRSPRHPTQAGAPSTVENETRTPRTVPSPSSTKTLLSNDNSQEPKSATALPPFTTVSAMSAFSSLTALPAVPAVPSSIDQFLVDPRTASLPRSKSVKNDIRPSRRRPQSPVETGEVKDTKTPVQRRATVGLPFNPRSRATRMFTGQRGAGNDQPIMFFNPEESSAPVYAVPEPDDNSDALSRKSVIHRPRPIPRKSIASLADSFTSDTDSMASTAELLATVASPIDDRFTIVSTPKLPMVSPVSVKTLSQSSLGTVAISPGSSALHKTVRRTSYVPELPALPTEFKGQQPKIAGDVAPEGTATSIWTVAPNEHAPFSLTNNDEPQSAYHNKRFSVNTQSSYEGTIGRNSVVFASDSKTTAATANLLGERRSRHESADSELSMMLRAAPLPPAADEGNIPEVPAVPDMFKDGRITPLSEEEEDAQQAAKELASWHRRIGEELPGFSSQLNDRRQRKLPVPKPLALNKPANITVVVEAEPSPEEPEQEALDRIHEQLKKLEDTDARATISEQQRLDLLANLESEMGAQESQWQMLKVDLAATPLTVISTPGGVPSVRSSVDVNGLARTRLSAGAGDLLLALQEEANRRLSTTSEQTPKDEVNRRSGRMSLISVSSRALSQIGSPTPPDTDESGADDSDNDSMAEDAKSAKETPESSTVTGFMALDEILSSSVETKNQPASPVDFEEISLPTPKATAPLMPAPSEEEPKAAVANASEPENIRFSLADLQQPVPAPPPSRPRSITRRPPRMSKRISALPDIVENPEPLAGRTGSLGIFQFAWGEKSDSATMPIRMSGLGGTMSSGRGWMMNAPPLPMLPSQALATHSFFEDDETDNGLDGYEDEDYDDGFDDSTLWEIADLLEADLEGSRDDLFVVGHEDVEEVPEVAPAAPAPVKEIAEVVEEQAQLPAPALWTAVKASQASKSWGLPQPTGEALEVFFAEASRPTARAVPRMKEEVASLTSSSLWEASTAPVASGMWCEHKGPREPEEIKTVTASSTVSSLWSPVSVPRSTLGLPQPDVLTWNTYIALPTRSVQRKATVQKAAEIKSTSLWQPSPAVVSPSGGVWAPKTLSVNQYYQPLPVSSKVVKDLMWSSTPAKAVSFGLPQPDAQTWTTYIALPTRSIQRKASVQKSDEIKSTSLWQPSATAVSPSGGVWAPKALSVKPSPRPLPISSPKVIKDLLWSSSPAKAVSFGLPQPEAHVWTGYLVPEGLSHRGAYVPTIVSITSTSLWAPTIQTRSEGMWMPTSKPSAALAVKPSPEPLPVSSTLVKYPLWSVTPAKTVSFGLPQPAAHVWTAYLVPEGRNHRGAYVPTTVSITSTSLWTPAVETQSEGLWMARSKPSATQEKPQPIVKETAGSLWAVPVTTKASFGLPQPEADVWATYLVPEGRNHRGAYVATVVTITSTSLWSPTIETQSDGMWMPKSKPSATEKLPELQEKPQLIVEETAGLLWTLPVITKASFGLPQPDAKTWESYIPRMTSASLRRVLISEPASIKSQALWSLSPKKEATSGFLWCSSKPQVAKPQPVVKKLAGSLWTPPVVTKTSLGLPQPDSKSWESYIPRMTSTSLRKVLISEPASIESQALWASSPKKEATSSLLWRSTEAQAEPVEILLQPAPTRTAHVRSSTAVLITKEQWNSAFKRISQQQAQPQTQAPAETPQNRAARSKSVKSRAFFDPAVMALIAELPSPTSFTPPSSHRTSVGRSKSVSYLPPTTRRPSHSASSSYPETDVRPSDFI
ncbi:hypothetical protein BBK36DRAFT_1123578 [Trichoderma citrinoviride]|uniref:Uncharacterized protein n=1 Tax=Trichoderma citrinoviride TaxID=58853 RepID=A0A2T4B5J8_9HYPO|nr:hypothetical protein BBK36DRAFT_1123578 [Trichoderma citrinoviride]PTB64605.1 hypothetical protein BBK36DRAFT_1123578 [Trichoderma citrinoviride]